METLKCDVLVVGTGIAGLSFALRAAQFADVIMATKKERSASATNYAQGGIASVIAPTDSFDKHVADTLAAGAGLCHPHVVDAIIHDGPQAVRDLVDWGVAFTRAADAGEESFDLALEGGHSQARVVHAGDFTGQEIENALLKRAMEHPRIEILEYHIATQLLVAPDAERGSRCYGADVLARENSSPKRICARAVLLATGGAGQVYQHSTNPSIATGDGVALAYRAGARVANLEFMQFHPTSFYRPGARTFLISEAVRGEGAVLRNETGEAFMTRYDPRAELAPRDIVARAIDHEMKRSGAHYVHLDITHKPADLLRRRFPNIYERLQQDGIDMAAQPIPVVPAAHYLCGGVLSDLDGKTDLYGLYVSGEVACTGMHGANRLASNSLLEAVVLSHWAARSLRDHLPPSPAAWPEFLGHSDSPSAPPGVLVQHLKRDARQIMWDYVGIMRSNERLDWARRSLTRLGGEAKLLLGKSARTYDLVELDYLLVNARLMVECAARRRESRGLHYNTDCPTAAEGSLGVDTVLEPDEIYVSA